MATFETKRLLLRPFRESDLSDFYEYGSMKKVGTMAGWTPYTDIQSAQKRLDYEITKPHQFAIELKAEHKVIGSIEVMEVKRERYKGIHIDGNSKELGSIVSEKYWGNGYMPEAIMEILKYCFYELGVKIVYAGYVEKNTQSNRLKEKTGFKEIGRVKNYRQWLDGCMSDLIAVSITKEEYEQFVINE